MSAEENKALVRRLVEETNRTRFADLTVMDEVYATNLIYHGTGDLKNGDLQGLKQFVSTMRTAFPDLQGTIDDIVVEGDKVVYRWTIRGTHKVEFNGIAPTGKQVAMNAISINRISGGKIVEEWEITDELGLMQQLGIVPPPGQQ